MSERLIYKYEIGDPCPHVVEIELPHGKVLSVGAQSGKLVMWAEVDTLAKSPTRRFGVAWTGRPFPWGEKEGEAPVFIGTVTVEGLVCHIYELP